MRSSRGCCVMAKFRLVFVFAAAIAAAVGPAVAQDASRPDRDAAAMVLRRAVARMETVCRVHAAEQRLVLAQRCYDDVTAMLAPAAAIDRASVPKAIRGPAVTRGADREEEKAKDAKAVALSRRPAPLKTRTAMSPHPIAQAEGRDGRCVTLLCSRYVLLGVGF